RLHAGGTEAIDRHAARRHRQARAQRDLPRDVLPRRAFRKRAAEDDVLDLRGIDARALHGFGDDMAAERGAMGVVERAAIGLAEPGARGGDDDGIWHGYSSHTDLTPVVDHPHAAPYTPSHHARVRAPPR